MTFDDVRTGGRVCIDCHTPIAAGDHARVDKRLTVSWHGISMKFKSASHMDCARGLRRTVV